MTDTSSIEETFAINHLDNAIDYLKMVNHFIECIDSEWKWKWVAISLHQALYSFMICALAGSDPKHSVIERDSSKKASPRRKRGATHALYSEGKSVAEISYELGEPIDTVIKWLGESPFLIDFDTALGHVQRTENLPRNNIKPLVLSRFEKDAVNSLKNDLRNEFEHFSPKIWIDPMSGMAPLVLPVLSVIQRLIFETNFIDFYQNDEKPQRIEQAISGIRAKLDVSE